MPLSYTCKRCGYEAFQKCNLLDHLSRKKPCKPLREDIPCNDLLVEVSTLQKKESKEWECGNCSKSYSHYSSLSRHDTPRAKARGFFRRN